MTSSEIRSSFRTDVNKSQIEYLPCHIVYVLAEIAAQLAEGRLSLRDRIAIAAMQSIMSNDPNARRQDVVESAYFYADGMIAEREFIEPIAPPDVDAEPTNEEIQRHNAEHKARLAEPVSDPEKFVRCVDCCKEIPRPSWATVGENTMCNECLPFWGGPNDIEARHNTRGFGASS